jgi:hypothetical protein
LRHDRRDPWDQRGFARAIQRLQREPAGIDLATLGHESLEVFFKVLLAGKRLVTDLWKATLHAQQDAGAIEQDRRLEPLFVQADRVEDVYQPDRALEGHGVRGHKRLFARLGLYVFENLGRVIDEMVAGFVGVPGDCGHLPLVLG